VTHDVEEAMMLSDRVLVLGERPGTLVGSFPVSFRRPRHASLTLDEEFLFLKRRIWAAIGLPGRTGGYCEKAYAANQP
jgi:ABC-type nitrate/sulfonate/bicarbonate transport system ATPase subunit